MKPDSSPKWLSFDNNSGLALLIYYGWVILAVAAVASFASAPGQTYTFSVFLEHFRDDLGLSSTLISTLYLIGTVIASVMIVGIGRALDVLGGRVMLVPAHGS